jgi:hypothetical protein
LLVSTPTGRSTFENDAKYIGLDVHQATISVAVLDSVGKLVTEAIPQELRSPLAMKPDIPTLHRPDILILQRKQGPRRLTRIATAVRLTTKQIAIKRTMKKLMPRGTMGAVAKRTRTTRPITGARTSTGAGGG